MPLERLYFDLSLRRFVTSFRTPQIIDAPVWGHGDIRDFGVTFLNRTDKYTVAVVDASSISAQVGISATTAPGTLLASVTAGAAVNNEFPFALNLGSTLDAFMLGETEEKEALGQFRIVTSLGESRFQFQVFISPKQLTTTSVDSTPDDPGLRKSEANALYMAKEVPVGTRQIWTDEVTGQVYNVGFANGQFQANLQ